MASYLVLGLIQGLTEFLPISSSAHLVFAQALFGLNPPGTVLEGVLHLGTLLAVLVYFRREIGRLVFGVLRGERESRRYLVLLVLGTIPIVVFGLLFREGIERAFSAVRMAGGMLLITGALLWAADRALGRLPGKGLSPVKVLGIGLAQAAALIPGISRSGATVSVGILLGLGAREAARFSFLLSIPAIAGAGLYSIGGAWGAIRGHEFWGIFVGGVIAFLSGILAIKLLLSFLYRGKLVPFGIYCFVIGIAALAFG